MMATKRSLQSMARRRKRLEDPEYRELYRKRQRDRHAKEGPYTHRKWKKWGGTPELYQQRFEEQGGKCGICTTPLKSQFDTTPDELPLGHFDHCHLNNRARGILCFRCNTYLGVYERWVKRHLTAIKNYRRKYAGTTTDEG